MCTRDGAPYLPAQLASFVAQTHDDWALWVSDDGSQDETLQILKQFRTDHPNRDIRLLEGPQQGGTRNFLSLLCHPDLGDGTIALSDQDDVWMPEKLARAGAAVTAGAQAYAAQSIVTDGHLTPTGQIDNAARGASFKNALVQNILHGATVVLTPAALDVIRRAGPRIDAPFHDWWIYQVLTGCDVPLTIDRNPVLYYRQHADNVLGANQASGARRRRGGLLRGGTYRTWIQKNLLALDGIRSDLSASSQTVLEETLAAQALPGMRRMQHYRRLGLHRQTSRQTALLMALTALGYA
ncbi:hypothetical protein BV911_12825 [Pseudoruegeria sp. SK021]|nr:hypothetical protein BV911_12825 [Pseudoruegeria sp. SK021]